ncbi:MAG: hypothetical protein Q9182_003713 [Xanthomendoza sp. 2 TL-2023]
MTRNRKKKVANIPDKKSHYQDMDSQPSGAKLPHLPGRRDSKGPTIHPSDSHDSAELNPRPTKRLKTTADSVLLSTSTTKSSFTCPSSNLKQSKLTESAPSISPLPLEIQHLRGQYDFSTMSIISSSKIHQKVKTLLALVESFSFANVSAKPGLVNLEAKAGSASKLISVVEIAKADIAKRGGKWYQYSKLQSELLPIKEKQKEHPLGGRTLADGEPERSSTADGSTGPQGTDIQGQTDLMDTEGDDSGDGDFAFETLQNHTGGPAGQKKTKIRATPIMTIYFSCVPVPGLKDLYG